MKKLFFILFTLSIFASCKMNFEAPTVSRTDNFKVSKISPQGIEGEITISIKNPNTIGFNIYKSSFDVTYGGVYLGQAKLKKRVHIGGNSDKTHTFSLKSSFKDKSLADITSLMSGRGGQLEIKGDLKVGKWFYKKKFPISHKQRVSLSQ